MKKILQQKSNFLNFFFSEQSTFFLAVIVISFLPIFSGQILLDQHTHLFGITINYLQIRITLHDILSTLFLISYVGSEKIKLKNIKAYVYLVLVLISYSGIRAYFSAGEFNSDNMLVYASASALALAQLIINSTAIIIAIQKTLTNKLSKNKTKILLVGISISTLIQLSIGILQIQNRDAILPNLLSWTGQPLSLTSHTYIGISRWARAYGTTPHPNILAGIANIFLIVALSQNIKNVYKALITIPIIMLIVISFSRASIITELIIISVYFFRKILIKINLKYLSPKFLILIFFVTQSIIIASIQYALLRINYTFTFVISRSIIQHSYLELTKLYPTLLITGTGYRMSIPTLLNNRLHLDTSLIYQNRLLAEPLHNILLLPILELGLPASLLLLYFYTKIVKIELKNLLVWQILALITFLIIIGGVDHWLFY